VRPNTSGARRLCRADEDVIFVPAERAGLIGSGLDVLQVLQKARVLRLPAEHTRESTIDEVTGFVADIRARSERVRDALDPQTAERVVVSALTSDDLDDLDAEELTKTKMLLLAAIIADEHLDDAGLDELLAAARKLADQLMS
jgi:hypothetical protein